MIAELYTISLEAAGRVSIMARPRGGDWLEDEIAALRLAEVDILVSLLTPLEVSELELAAEERYCQEHGITFFTLPIPDRGVPPSRDQVAELVLLLQQRVETGRHVAVHCRQGIGRASLVAAALLAILGYGADEALDRLAAVRGRPVPDTDEQREWVRAFARAVTDEK